MSAQTRYELLCHPLFLTIAGALNLPPLVFGVQGFTLWCNYYSSWLVGNACLTGLNMVAAIYSVYKIRKISPSPTAGLSSQGSLGSQRDLEKDGDDTDSNNERSEDMGESSADTPNGDIRRRSFSRLLHLRTISSDRIRHMVCYDGVITTYSILFFFWIFWLSEGAQRKRQLDGASEDVLEGCEEFHDQYVQTSLVCGFCYFSFVTLAVLSSLCAR